MGMGMGMGMKMNFVPYSESKISLQQAYMYLIQDTCILFLVYHCLLFILVAAYHNLDRHKTVSIALRHENLMVVHFELLLFICQDDDEEQRLWRDLCLDRMVRAVESSLVVLIILTSPSMPKQLYLEEVIARVISFTKYQLRSNIFPEYDPIYRESDPNGKRQV